MRYGGEATRFNRNTVPYPKPGQNHRYVATNTGSGNPNHVESQTSGTITVGEDKPIMSNGTISDAKGTEVLDKITVTEPPVGSGKKVRKALFQSEENDELVTMVLGQNNETKPVEKWRSRKRMRWSQR